MKYKVLRFFWTNGELGKRSASQYRPEWDREFIADNYSDTYVDWLISEGYIEEIKEEKSVVFVPKEGQEYFFMDSVAFENHTYYSEDDDYDVKRVSVGNCYETREDCQFAIEKAKVIRELEVLANFKPDWSDFQQVKHYIQYDRCNGVLTNCNNQAIESQGLIFFRSVDELNHAVQQIGEDRILKYLFNVEK